MLQTFHGKVWLTETGGIVKLGTLVPGEHEPRARRRWAACSRLAKSNSRISALFVYQFNPPPDPATADFDAGLINPGQLAAPRLRRRQEPQGAQLPQVGH